MRLINVHQFPVEKDNGPEAQLRALIDILERPFEAVRIKEP